MLEYLKICVDSIEKNSVLDNELCICVDGSTDGTLQWLDMKGLPYTARENRGAFSAWNECAKLATKDYVFVSEDDFYHCPNWDIRLAEWLQHMSDDVVLGPQLIEPFRGSYVYYDCGDGPWGKPFDESKLQQWVEQHSRHKYVKQPFLMPLLKLSDWRSVGGFDERYDPCASGMRDLQMKIHHKHPRKWIIVENAYLYHFKPQNRLRPNVLGGKEFTTKISIRNAELFKKKWGMNIPESEKFLDGV